MTAQLLRHDLEHPDGRPFFVYGPLNGTLNGQSAETSAAALHLRLDRATHQWIAVSPSRNARPGGVVAGAATTACPLCAGGAEMPFAFDAVVFENRFPAFVADPPLPPSDPLAAPSFGRCEVVVYTDRHEGSMATLPPQDVARVIAILRDRTAALWAEGHAYVMAFENRGAGVGATLTHPHGQIYAFGHLPPTVQTKVSAIAWHRTHHGSCLGCQLVEEDGASDRAIFENESFVVSVPYAARWPYEVHVRAIRHGLGRLADLTNDEALDLARAVRDVVDRYDGLFDTELPYMMCVQEAPEGVTDWHLHVEFLPPHRSADRLKVRASVETALGVFINDTLPERSAERLAAVSTPRSNWTGVTVPAVYAAINVEMTQP